jgi:hypothetical protein
VDYIKSLLYLIPRIFEFSVLGVKIQSSICSSQAAESAAHASIEFHSLICHSLQVLKIRTALAAEYINLIQVAASIQKDKALSKL